MTERTASHHRYAVYFAPHPGTLGWLAGSHWLGRCAAQLEPLAQLRIDGVSSEQLHALTAAPRRYGWHATLRAPFALAEDADWLSLHHAVQQVAQGLQPFFMPPLLVERLDDFLALVPRPGHPAIAQINAAAAACVQGLQPLAAPLSASELRRRRAAGLSPAQDALLQQWGYPFVLEEFRFHLSLTGPLGTLPPEQQLRVTEAAREFFADLPMLRFDSLAIFAEPTPGAEFILLDHVELGA